MKVKSIEIEGFHNVDKKTYNFKDINYIKGPNGSGKSTILQAIQLAILGYIPGTNKTKEAIFKHANGKILAVSVVLEGEETVKISRVWSGTGSTISSVLDIEPKDKYDITQLVSDIELPIFNFSDFLSLTANKQKDWFINFLPKSSMSIDWKAELENSISDASISDIDALENEVLSELNISSPDVEGVRRSNAYLKSLLSAKKSELVRLQGTIQSSIYYDNIEDIDEEELQSRIQDLQVKKSERMKYDSISDKNKSVEIQLLNYINLKDTILEDDKVSKYSADINRLNTEITELSGNQKVIQQKILELKSEIYQLDNVLKYNGICPITNLECTELKSKLADTSNRKTELNTKLSNLSVENSDVEHNIASKKQELQHIIKLKSDLEYQYNMRDALIKTKLPEIELSDDRTAEELDVELKSAYDELSKLQANAQYESLIDKITKDKFVLENEIEALKIWVKLTDVNGLQAQSTDAFEPLKQKLDEYVPKLFGRRTKSKFNIQAKANSFSFGIERNKTYIPYDLLSSGEKCLYVLALMISLVDMSSSKLKLVMADDIFDHLDNKNAESLFKVLQKIDNVQMIFAGVKDIKNVDNIISIK